MARASMRSGLWSPERPAGLQVLENAWQAAAASRGRHEQPLPPCYTLS